MKYFDILPAKKPLKQTRKKSGEFVYFLFVALGVFSVMMAGSLVGRGQIWVTDSLPVARAGIESLTSAAKSLVSQNPQESKVLFEKADSAFRELEGSLGFLGTQARGLEGGIYSEASQYLLSAAQKISKLGGDISVSLKVPEKFPTLEELRIQTQALEKLLAQVESIQQDIASVSVRALPAELRPKLIWIQETLGTALSALIEAKEGMQAALVLMGDKKPHHFMVLLQNSAERRATGGFIGSLVLAETNNGKVTKMDFKDVYEIDGQLTVNIEPPAGIREVTDRYALRDANYSPDFSVSAQQILEFLEQSKGPSVDTVIAINEKMVEDLLKITGPIRLPSLGLTFTSEDFALTLSYWVEAKVSGMGSPKKIMAELMPILQEKFMASITPEKAIEMAQSLIENQDFLVYSQDAKVQSAARQFRVDGSMVTAAPKTDFLEVVSTSIGGNKSDRFIQTEIQHETAISGSGHLLNTVTIQKTHTWNDAIFETLRPLISRFGTGPFDENTLKFILGQGPNVDYMRVYIPKGSKLVDVQGIEASEVIASEDLGYTVLGFKFTPVQAGQSRAVTLEYELPFTLGFAPTDLYRLIVGSQPGADLVTLKKTFALEEGVRVIQNYPTSTSAFKILPEFETALDHNQFFITSLKAL